MINAAIVGLGWWGKTLVEAAEKSDAIRFISGASSCMRIIDRALARVRGKTTTMTTMVSRAMATA